MKTKYASKGSFSRRSLSCAAACSIATREREDADIEVLVSVYTATGQCVVERTKQLPGAEWTVHDALKRGIDQAERIAGGESGRLPCADAHLHEDD